MLMIPVSLGELIDKITILEIKLLKIQDVQKIKNVHTEYDALTQLPEYLKVRDHSAIVECKKNLLAVNLRLWKIEDAIREKEREKNFDSDFIQLARSVYITNDERSKLKKDINVKYGSAIVEEKSYKDY